MKKINIFIICLLSIIFIFSGYKILSLLNERKVADDLYTDVANNAIIENNNNDISSQIVTSSEEKIETESFKLFDIDFETLSQQNGDITGWIYLPDSPINYPVLKCENNEKYLDKMFNGKYNSAGSIFADYRNTSLEEAQNFIIYGHNMKNGTMFGYLKKYRNQSYYDSHPYFYYLTPEKKYRINLIAGFVTQYDSDAFEIYRSNEDFNDYISECINKSTFKSQCSYTSSEKVVTLATCTGSNNNERYVILGVLQEY